MAYRDTILADKPLVYLPLDPSSLTSDASGSGRTVSIINGGAGNANVETGLPLVDPSQGGGSVRFKNGAYSQWEPSAWIPSPSITLEVWAKFPTVSDYYALWDRDHYSLRVFQFRINPQNKVEFIYWTSAGGPYFVSGSPLTLGSIYHLVATYDASDGAAKVYVNGALSGSANNGPSPMTSTQSLLLLGAGTGGTGSPLGHYPDWLSHPAYYGTALSAERIAEHYAVGLRAPTSTSSDCWVWNGSAEIPANVSVWDGTAEVPSSLEVV